VNRLIVALALVGLCSCSRGNCTEQSCADWGGSASKKFNTCYVSGSGSSKDEFWLEDSSGTEVYRCERPADDNNSCGVELIRAKEAFCK
jgi:hypothetical protein